MSLNRFASSAGGIRIIEDPSLTETVPDWSCVRSPSRAARRLRQGHRQNIRWIEVPKPIAYGVGDAFVMHPEFAAKLRARLAESPYGR